MHAMSLGAVDGLGRQLSRTPGAAGKTDDMKLIQGTWVVRTVAFPDHKELRFRGAEIARHADDSGFGFARHWFDGLVVVRLKRSRKMEVCHETIGTEHCGFRSVRSAAWAQTNKALEIVPDDALGFILIKDLRQLQRQGRGSGREDEWEASTRIQWKYSEQGPPKRA